MRTPALFLVAAFVLASGAGLPAARAAETACKGLATDVCKGNTSCSWVKPHKIKSGKEVAGFCRKKGVRQSKAQAKAS